MRLTRLLLRLTRWLRRNLKAWHLAPTCQGCRDELRIADNEQTTTPT